MASALIVTLTDRNFVQEVLKTPQPILVDFWAEWCSPCKMIAPVLDELAEEYQGRVRIGKVDVAEHQHLAVQYQVTAIPTLILFKGGEVVQQIRGAKSKKELKASLDRVAA
jgi:thioredoxin 1